MGTLVRSKPRRLDPEAVKVANERLWTKHPELNGRQLTNDPADAPYRKAWNQLYDDAAKEVQPPEPRAVPEQVAPPPEKKPVVEPCTDCADKKAAPGAYDRAAIEAEIAQARSMAESLPEPQRTELLAAADRLEKDMNARERALLANDIYNIGLKEDTGPPPGWKRVSGDDLPENLRGLPWQDDKSGFRAQLYESDRGERVLVFQGTNFESLTDWKNNVQQGVGMKSTQYEQAIEISQAVHNQYGGKVDMAGHSLGGGLASAASVVTGSPGTTFNAAGLHKKTVERHGFDRATGNQLVDAYRVDGEILTKVQEDTFLINRAMPDSVGRRIDMPPAPGDVKSGAVGRHGMDHVNRSLEHRMSQDLAIIRNSTRRPPAPPSLL